MAAEVTQEVSARDFGLTPTAFARRLVEGPVEVWLVQRGSGAFVPLGLVDEARVRTKRRNVAEFVIRRQVPDGRLTALFQRLPWPLARRLAWLMARPAWNAAEIQWKSPLIGRRTSLSWPVVMAPRDTLVLLMTVTIDG